jgi:hypothetical protein
MNDVSLRHHVALSSVMTYVPVKIAKGSTMDKDKHFQMRVSQDFLNLLDEFRREQADLPSRAEAIRRMVVAGNAFRPSDIMVLVALACSADRGPVDKEMSEHAMAAVERITDRLKQTSIKDRTIGIEDIINTVGKEKGDR